MDSAAHGVRHLVRLGRVRDLPRLEQRVEYVLRHRRPASAVLGAQGGLGDLEVDERPYTMRMRAPSSAKIRVHCIMHACGGSRWLRSRRTSDPRGGARAPPRAREPRRIPDLPRGRRRARAGGGRARPPASPRGSRRSSGTARRCRGSAAGRRRCGRASDSASSASQSQRTVWLTGRHKAMADLRARGARTAPDGGRRARPPSKRWMCSGLSSSLDGTEATTKRRAAPRASPRAAPRASPRAAPRALPGGVDRVLAGSAASGHEIAWPPRR